ncbi:MAG: DUF6522 family protein [Steroidobacteraceae bacterium]
MAQNLGLEPAIVLDLVHADRITAVHEQGVAEDAGLTRVTFDTTRAAAHLRDARQFATSCAIRKISEGLRIMRR